MSKKALLVISFGTSYAGTRKKTIEAAEADLSQAFAGYDLKRAFTSHGVINKLRKRDNLEVDTVSQAVEKLLAEGYSEVIAQPLHVINGTEYHLVLRELKPRAGQFEKFAVGVPLLSHHRDYLAVVEALRAEFPPFQPEEAVVLMGHGSEHPADSAYAALDYVFKDEGLSQVYVGTVEGYPTLDTVIKHLEADKVKSVLLMPFMLVAGDHAINDMAGDEPDSWKSILTSKGFAVQTRLVGLGELEKIRQIYVDHARAALEDEAA